MRAIRIVDVAERESTDLDFKGGFNPTAMHDWCELIKDIVAMANSGGGEIIVGVNDDGTPSGQDLAPFLELDPATVVDKIQKYTGIQFADFGIQRSFRGDAAVGRLYVGGISFPMVFISPGTYDIGGGKQSTAFSRGTVYFRHGAKSEPGTSEDLRDALNRELERVRHSWLDGIQKVVTAPVGATISVLPAEVMLSGSETGTSIRLVNDDDAPAFKAYRTDLLYPYRQKELLNRLSELLDGARVTAHDIFCVRKTHKIESQPNFFYKPQFSSPQYSEALADWITLEYARDPNFFLKAREACRKH